MKVLLFFLLEPLLPQTDKLFRILYFVYLEKKWLKNIILHFLKESSVMQCHCCTNKNTSQFH